MSEDAGAVVERFWTLLDAMRWQESGALLAPDVVFRFADSGRVLDSREAVVAFNAAYPGRSRCRVSRVVDDGAGTAAAEVEVVNDERGRFWCAGFYTVADGLVTTAVEYWGVEEPPA